MRRSLIILISFLFFAQSFSAQSIKFEFDFARFRANDSTALCEFYYQFDKKTLTRDKANSVVLNLKLEISAKNAEPIIKRFEIRDKCDSNSVSSAAVGKFDLFLTRGRYFVRLTATDAFDAENKIVITDSLIVNNYDSEKPLLSDIELAYGIKKSNEKKSSFYKHTFEVIPNPELIFSYLKPEVFYYFEIYNVDKTLSDSLVLFIELFSGDGQSLYKKKAQLGKQNEAIVKVGQIVMSEFPTDSYLLRASVADVDGKFAFSTIKKFFFVNPSVKKKSKVNFTGVTDAKFGGLSETECDKLFREVQYLTTKKEKNLYESLKTVEEKRRFLADFWKKRDKLPDTERNEFMEEYFRRLDYVNKRFRTKTKAGYLTDRGRVYLIYGEPDEIDRYPYSVNAKPYEIWYYHSIEGGVVFVFGDLTGIGDYRLLHSTKRGELYDSNWRERIRAF